MAEQRIRIVNQLGLHARAAGKLAELARRFSSRITVHFGQSQADARSILDLLTLGAGFDSWIDVSAEGADETEALEAVSAMFRDGFGEG